jgi:hypothetical protein
MAMPELTAETSLYRTTANYHAARDASRATASLVVPQQRQESTCGECTCSPWHCCKVVGGACKCHSCSDPAETALTAPATLLRA